MNLDLVQVLLIDDDEDDFVNIQAVLSEITRSRYKLTWKNSYTEGFQALTQGKFDVVLLDYRLGQSTGLDLLREARDQGIATPMIILTGYGDFEIDIKAMQSGAADYLVKSLITAPLLERSIRYSVKHALDMSDLSEQRENFRVLFNSTFEGIVVHRNESIIDANAAMGEIFGYSHQDILAMRLVDFIQPDSRAEFEKTLNSGDITHVEIKGCSSSGAELSLGISSRTVLVNGLATSLLAVRDLTQEKLMEAQIIQQDRMASLGLLASSLAHEIGTPLSVIRGRAELLARGADEKTQSTVQLITGQIDVISKLVHSLLHIARGKSSDNVADVALPQVLGDVCNLISHELTRKDIELKINCPELVIVRSEPGPLGQVFLNLLVNSIHAIEEAKKSGRTSNHFISITVSPQGSGIGIDVADSGCGISEANLRQLFKPFFTTKDVGLGTGLGLATSYKLLHSWGGTVTVETKVNEGTVFKLTLRGRVSA